MDLKEKYAGEQFVTKVRDKEIVTKLKTKSLSGLMIPRVSLPKYVDYGEILGWVFRENVPGFFPYTAGVFPFKREGKTRSGNLPVKDRPTVPTGVFIIYQRMILLNG